MPETTEKTRVSFLLPLETLADFRQAAQAAGLTMSGALMLAMREFIKKDRRVKAGKTE